MLPTYISTFQCGQPWWQDKYPDDIRPLSTCFEICCGLPWSMTNYLTQSPSLEANKSSARQEIPCITVGTESLMQAFVCLRSLFPPGKRTRTSHNSTAKKKKKTVGLSPVTWEARKFALLCRSTRQAPCN